jgi:hypothetical protein
MELGHGVGTWSWNSFGKSRATYIRWLSASRSGDGIARTSGRITRPARTPSKFIARHFPGFAPDPPQPLTQTSAPPRPRRRSSVSRAVVVGERERERERERVREARIYLRAGGWLVLVGWRRALLKRTERANL